MKLYFFASSFYGGRQVRVMQRLLENLKEKYDTKLGVVFTDESHFNNPSKESILELVADKINESKDYKDLLLFSGVGISLHIKALWELYPDAQFFMMKRHGRNKENNDKILIGINDPNADTSWINDYNLNVRQGMNYVASEAGASWGFIDRPIFRRNGRVNYTEDNQASEETTVQVITVNI